MKKRPNIVIINPDQMRADSMFHLGNPAAVARTVQAIDAAKRIGFRPSFEILLSCETIYSSTVEGGTGA